MERFELLIYFESEEDAFSFLHQHCCDSGQTHRTGMIRRVAYPVDQADAVRSDLLVTFAPDE